MNTKQQATKEVDVVRELDLGEQNTLFIMSNNSIDLMDFSGEPRSCVVHNCLHLSPDETYRLFISLQEMYK